MWAFTFSSQRQWPTQIGCKIILYSSHLLNLTKQGVCNNEVFILSGCRTVKQGLTVLHLLYRACIQLNLPDDIVMQVDCLVYSPSNREASLREA